MLTAFVQVHTSRDEEMTDAMMCAVESDHEAGYVKALASNLILFSLSVRRTMSVPTSKDGGEIQRAPKHMANIEQFDSRGCLGNLPFSASLQLTPSPYTVEVVFVHVSRNVSRPLSRVERRMSSRVQGRTPSIRLKGLLGGRKDEHIEAFGFGNSGRRQFVRPASTVLLLTTGPGHAQQDRPTGASLATHPYRLIHKS